MQCIQKRRAGGFPGQAGFTLFELVLVIAVVSVLAGVLFSRMLFYQEAAEKAVMEETASALGSALYIQVAGRVARGRNEEIPKMAQRNPMDWLAKKPKNYYGEYYNPMPGDVPPGNWYFDLKDHHLVYLVERGEHFVPGPDGRKWVRYRLKLIYNEPQPDSEAETGEKELGGLVLEAAGTYSWLK